MVQDGSGVASSPEQARFFSGQPGSSGNGPGPVIAERAPKVHRASLLGKVSNLTGEAGSAPVAVPRVRRATMLGRVANAMGTRDSEVESTLEKVKRRRKSHVVDLDAAQVPVSYDDTKHADLRRKHLLHLTRRADPLHLVWDVRHLTYTALPRVVRSVNMLCIIGAYAASAVTTRLGVWSSESAMLVDEMDSIDGMELLVTFNLVFYFGYCYSRFWDQQALAMKTKNCISMVCSLARGSQMSDAEVTNVWRWLNLAHLAGYVGLSPVYTRVNLIEGLAREHSLMHRKSYEFAKLAELDVGTTTGPAGYGEFIVWVLRAIECAVVEGKMIMATAENAQAQLLQMRAGLTGLFDFQFHVIPFCYVHLVALLTNCYLMVVAIAKGRLFMAEASMARGLILPVLALSFLSISCLSLIEIGGRMQNPFGTDDEDLPVHHLVSRACEVSKLVIESKPPINWTHAHQHALHSRADLAPQGQGAPNESSAGDKGEGEEAMHPQLLASLNA